MNPDQVSARRRVADVLRRDVVTIAPTASVRDLAALLSRHGVSGVPVVDAGGRLVGMVSSTDILWLLDRLGARSFSGSEVFSGPVLDETVVRDIMTPDVFGVSSSTTIGELLDFFIRTGVHRAVVADDGALAGIVSLSDVLGLMIAAVPA
jgi:CBS domain-containing protein